MSSEKQLQRSLHEFAKRKHLVIISDDTDHATQAVKGFLFLPKRRDQMLCVGHVNGHDISLLVRSIALPHSDEWLTRLVIEFLWPSSAEHLVALSSEHSEEDIRHILAGYHHYSRLDVPGWQLYTSNENVQVAHSMQSMLNVLRAYGVNDVEIDATYLRLYIDTLDSASLLDKIIETVADL